MNSPKDRTKVLILSGRHRIRGDIAHFPDARLTDYMNEAKTFIAVTDAEITDAEGRHVLSAPFLNVRCDTIAVIVPEEGAMID